MLIDDKQQYASQNQVQLPIGDSNMASNDHLMGQSGMMHHFFGSELGSREQIHQEQLPEASSTYKSPQLAMQHKFMNIQHPDLLLRDFRSTDAASQHH